MSNGFMQSAVVPIQVKFKYQLGELILNSWEPFLIPLELGQESAVHWPEIEKLPISLPSKVEGYQCRRTELSRFPRGISWQEPWLCYSPRQEQHYYVEISGTFEEYLKRRSAKSRQNLKRSVKHFLELTPNSLIISTTPNEILDFHHQAAAISKCTYQERLLGSGLPASPDFLRFLQEKALDGGVRGYILRDGVQPIAYALCLSRGENLVYEFIGYLPQHAERSPGTVLLYLILQDLFDLGKYPMLDFGPGQAFYKESFATCKNEYAESYLFRNTLKNRLKLNMLWRFERFSGRVGVILERYGMKKKIRQAMRVVLGKLRE